MISLNFRDAPLDQVLDFYGQMTGRTMIKAPGLNATVTLRGQSRLTQKEALSAIESILSLQNVSLIPMGKKFYRVIQTSAARQEGMPISTEPPPAPLPPDDHLVSQIIELKHITITEATPVLQSLIHGYGKIQPMERQNTLLITDTSANIQCILDMIDFIDRPEITKVETRIYEIHYTEATKLAAILNQLIQESQGAEQKPRAAVVPAPAAPAMPGIIRPPATRGVTDTSLAAAQELAARGIIQGKVKIVADDRTNIMIILSEPANFAFFDKIINVLDQQVEPEVMAKVIPLEFAEAEEISSVLNTFIGAAAEKPKTTGEGGETTTDTGMNGDNKQNEARSRELQNYIEQQAAAQRGQPGAADTGKSKIGELSPKTKILADKRTNSLLLMGRKKDIAALVDIIDQLDIMLAQVVIEAVILEVDLKDNLEYGIEWLQRAVNVFKQNKKGPNGGIAVRQPIYAFAGGMQYAQDPSFRDASQLTASSKLPLTPGALTYYTTFYDLNLDAVIRLSASDDRLHILSTPVILTTDNKNARIVIGEQRPVVTSTTTSSSTDNQTDHYEYKDIGIELDVTPHINPQRFVVMEIKQKANNVGGTVLINANKVPVIIRREMEAQIAVESRSTIVLGGLVSTDKHTAETKIPILGDIPLLGFFFRSTLIENNRVELLVLITPYVLMTPDEARSESARLKKSCKAGDMPWPKNWSLSPLATPEPEDARAQMRAEKAKAREAALQLEEARSREGSALSNTNVPKFVPATHH